LDHSFIHWETHGHQLAEPVSTPAKLKAFQVSPVEPVAYLIELNIAGDPTGADILGADAVMLQAQHLSDPIKSNFFSFCEP
jgi:hypothetical protein